MAEAYASLVSLMNIIDSIRDYPQHLFSLDNEQLESIQEKAAFLVDFLECYSHGDNKEVEALESQIADASHAAEDLIEYKVVDYIHKNQSTSFDETRSNPFCQHLQEVIEVMDLMKKEAMKIKEKGEVKVQLPKDSILPSSSSISLSAGKDTMVGFDDVLNQIMDRLTGQQSDRQIIPISGMGGIGKTTLTRNIYQNRYIVEYFDIRAWVTISQKCEIKEILSTLLIEFKVLTKETTQETNESQLGEKIHKHLFGRRYLIVMDDMWSIDVWDKVQLFFPENRNGSGIMITTRPKNIASQLGSCGIELHFLDEDQSWNLLREKVFGQQECTLELEEIGKKIAKNCKGLPLSIVVIAGLLAKSDMTREYWYHVAKQVNHIVTLADDGQCSKILYLSYINLPVHLKPCFLYMGVFPEDYQIHVSRLIKLWVAEGFLKPNKIKSLEEVAEEYLMDLIDRNHIMVHEQGSRGNVKICKIHDLLGDICMSEAQKVKFLCVARNFKSSQALHNQRRIVIDGIEKEQKDVVPLLRSITFNTEVSIKFDTELISSFVGGRLIRVLNVTSVRSSEFVFNLVNFRYLNFRFVLRLPSSINLLWNLQTLIIRGIGTSKPREIWKMKQLRHLDIYLVNLPKPPPLIAAIDGGQEDSILKHLQTLKGTLNLTFSEGVVMRIPNIKKLQIIYEDFWEYLDIGKDYLLSNLQYLQKLESLRIVLLDDTHSYETNLLGKLFFPHSLKKLVLEGSRIPWEHMTIIGCLPNLQVLKLENNAFIGQEWNPIDGQFFFLKYLSIDSCDELKFWNAESIHFPNLEQLILYDLKDLEEIPLGIGDIPTLRSIKLVDCMDSVVSSAIDILDEQESLGNADIKVEVWLQQEYTQLKKLEARDNFEVHYYYA